MSAQEFATWLAVLVACILYKVTITKGIEDMIIGATSESFTNLHLDKFYYGGIPASGIGEATSRLAKADYVQEEPF